jgi:hypothetical protein
LGNFIIAIKSQQNHILKLMKKHLLSLAIAVLTCGALFSSCKKTDDSQPAYTCTSCITTPQAKAVNDASSKGIYKGVVVGSSGTIKFDISNDASSITATMVIDGQTVVLTSNVTWSGSTSYVAPFTGTLNGQTVTINFSVDFDGSDPVITSSSIPGHPNAAFTLVKESSSALIECFEGTYSTSKPETGTFNILLSRQLGKWGGVARENGSTDHDDINGTIDSNGKLKDEGGHEIGTLTGDQISGSFTDSNNSTVNISGKRTL